MRMFRLLAVWCLVMTSAVRAEPNGASANGLGNDPDSTDVVVEDEAFDPGDLDPATLAELDVLLFDPVGLETGADLDRLAELPWLTHGDLESLRAALPIRSLNELVTRAGWPLAIAGETAPFVRPAARIAERTAVSLVVHRTRTDARWQHGGDEMHLRVAPERRTAHGGLQAARGPVRIVVGEFVATHALGLVVGRLRRSADANRAAWPGGRRLGLATGPGLARGAAIALADDRIVAFTGQQDTLMKTALAARGTWRGTGLSAAVVRDGKRLTTGVGVDRMRAGSRAGFEAARPGADYALAVATEARAGRLDADARFERTRRDWDRNVAGGKVQVAEARARLRLGAALLEGGVARRAERVLDGARVESLARRLRVLWRRGVHGCDATLTERSRTERRLQQGFEAASHTATHTLALAAWRTGAERVFSLEARCRFDPQRGRFDRAWQARIEKRRGHARWSLAVATFAARQAIALPLPAAAHGSSMRGDGMRFAAGVRAVFGRCELRAAASRKWIDGIGWQSNADASLALRFASHASPRR